MPCDGANIVSLLSRGWPVLVGKIAWAQQRWLKWAVIIGKLRLAAILQHAR